MPLALSIIVFVIGTSIGSFLNVVILRLGRESIRGRSKCPHCGTILRWHELLPVVSYIMQFGKCRFCRKSISLQYPLVELVTGICFLLILDRFVLRFPGMSFSPDAVLSGKLWWVWGLIIVWWYYISALIIISAYDIRHYLIPDAVLLPAILVGAASVVVQYLFIELREPLFPTSGITFLGAGGMLFGEASAGFLGSTLVGVVFATVLLGALHYFSRGRAMGFGDVKLGVFMGLVLGWPATALALMASFVFGSAVSIAPILAGRKTLKSLIPFGPFLALGTATTMLFGDAMIDQYFSMVSKLFPI